MKTYEVTILTATGSLARDIQAESFRTLAGVVYFEDAKGESIGLAVCQPGLLVREKK